MSVLIIELSILSEKREKSFLIAHTIRTLCFLQILNQRCFSVLKKRYLKRNEHREFDKYESANVKAYLLTRPFVFSRHKALVRIIIYSGSFSLLAYVIEFY